MSYQNDIPLEVASLDIRKRIRPRWSEYPVDKKPMTMEQRVRELGSVLRRLNAAVEKELAPEIIGVFDPRLSPLPFSLKIR
jgi:hypothetical protein